MVFRDKIAPEILPTAQFISYNNLMILRNQGELSNNRNWIRPTFNKGFTIIDIDKKLIYIVARKDDNYPMDLLKLKDSLYSLRWYMLLYDVGDIVMNVSSIKDHIHVVKQYLDNFDYNIYLKEDTYFNDKLYSY